MNRSFSHWQVAGFLFTSILGTFLHFLFDLTGGSAVAALFSAVNESIFEHMKLLFYPMVLFALWQSRFRDRSDSRYWCIKLRSILLGLVLIPALYYTYRGMLGVSADWFNITIFFLAAGAAFLWEHKAFKEGLPCRITEKTALILLALMCVLFTLFTFTPPQLPFFRDPVTGTYGFQK